MSEGDYVPKIAVFPGAPLTPEVVLNRTVAKLGRLKSVVIVLQWDDETFDCDWSSMKTSELCMAKEVLQIQVQNVVVDKDKIEEQSA
jgi:hypothetical protein